MAHADIIAADLKASLLAHLNEGTPRSDSGHDEGSILADHAAGLVLGYFGDAITAEDIRDGIQGRVPEFDIEGFLAKYEML